MADDQANETSERGGSTSIRDALSSALTEHGTTAADLGNLPAEGKPDRAADGIKADAKLGEKPAADTSERPRAPDGKFAPKTTQEGPAAAAKPAGAAPATEPKAGSSPDAKSTTDGAAPAQPPILAPASWPAAAKAQWATIPRESQEFLAKRENEWRTAYQQKAEQANQLQRRYTEIDQVLEPYRQKLALNGISEAAALKTFFAMNDFLDRDPVGALKYLAQGRGVDLGKLSPPQQAADGYVDPSLQHALSKVQQLEQVVAQLQQKPPQWYEQQQAEQARQFDQQQNVAVLSEFDKVAGQVNADGSPKYPHMADLLEDIVPHVARLRRANPSAPIAEIVDKAYDKAVWSHDDLRQHRIDAQAATDAARRVEEQKQAAAKAQRAGVQVNGSPTGSAAPPSKGRSIRQLLEQAAAGAA